MTAAIIDGQMGGFKLAMKRPNYSALSVHSNQRYSLFIFKQSFKYHIKNVSNQNRFLNYHLHTFGLKFINTSN